MLRRGPFAASPLSYLHMHSGRKKRKTPVHMPIHVIGGRASIIFLTVCTKRRKSILANGAVHELLLKAWTAANHWAVGRYILMPDHVHLFCAPATTTCAPLEDWVKYWKSYASQRWPRPSEQPVWQKSFWDTQLRRVEGYDSKWEYTRHNPVRKGLSRNPETWPYQGVVNVLEWRD